MSDSSLNRSKRSLSPNTGSHMSLTARKTSRPNHNLSAADRAAVLALDAQQKDELIKKLLDFHPSARQTISSVLPTITPTQPVPKVKLTESRYFSQQVLWCSSWLRDSDWARHPTMPHEESCKAITRAVGYEVDRIEQSFRSKDSQNLPRECSSIEEFSADASVAMLEIWLLLLSRTERLWREMGECDSYLCDAKERADCCMSDLIYDMWPEEQSDYEFWDNALFHECLDGSRHPLRVVCERYMALPSLLPAPTTTVLQKTCDSKKQDEVDAEMQDEREGMENDDDESEKTDDGSEQDDDESDGNDGELSEIMCDRIDLVVDQLKVIVRGNGMPEPGTNPIPGLDGMSI